MSIPIETDPEKIAKKERKQAIQSVVALTGLAIGLTGLAYTIRNDPQKQQLESNYAYCSDLIERAAGNTSNDNFVYDQVRIKEGIYRGYPCRQIVDEYNAHKSR